MKNELPHYGQILTKKETILNYIDEIVPSVDKGTVFCISVGQEHHDYKAILYSVCSKLLFLSKLVYKGKDGIIKLPCERYEKELFEGYLETKEEMKELLDRLTIYVTADMADYVFVCLQTIKKLWCQMIACRVEQVFIDELAYAADYVIEKKGDLPPPKFETHSLFPTNYDDFNYTQGIAKYFNKIEMR